MGKLNIELFKAVREKIKTTPEAYDQSRWARESESAPCGTAACIAGWACVLSGALSPQELKRRGRGSVIEFASIEIAAQEALGLSDEEIETVFTENPAGTRDKYTDERSGGWPEPFAQEWEDGISPATVATRYLDHIIETGTVLE